MMEADTAPAEKYTIERVFSRTISNILKDWKTFALFTAVAATIVSIAGTYGYAGTVRNLSTGSASAAIAYFKSPNYWGHVIFGFSVQGLVFCGMMGGILRSQFDEAINFGTLLKFSLKYFLKYIMISIVWYIGLIFGFVLLIIPAFILALMWSVSLPYLIDHDSGIWDALRGSRELTKGVRWKILASVVLFVLAQVIVLFLLQGFSLKGFIRLYGISPILFAAVQFIYFFIFYLFAVSFFTSIYQEVKLVKASMSSTAAAEPALALS